MPVVECASGVVYQTRACPPRRQMLPPRPQEATASSGDDKSSPPTFTTTSSPAIGTNLRSNRRTNARSNRRTNACSNRRSNARSNRRTNARSNRRTNARSNRRSNESPEVDRCTGSRARRCAWPCQGHARGRRSARLVQRHAAVLKVRRVPFDAREHEVTGSWRIATAQVVMSGSTGSRSDRRSGQARIHRSVVVARVQELRARERREVRAAGCGSPGGSTSDRQSHLGANREVLAADREQDDLLDLLLHRAGRPRRPAPPATVRAATPRSPHVTKPARCDAASTAWPHFAMSISGVA